MMKRLLYVPPTIFIKSREEQWEKLENYKFIGEDLTEKETIPYFNNKSDHVAQQQYDLFFSFTKSFPLYDQRKSRDNRGYPNDIYKNIFKQERNKAIPPTSSMMYGRPIRLKNHSDYPMPENYKQAQIETFYRRHGVMPPIEKEVQ
ncbi:hypothetical protein FQR65_LT03269 [Abscondita terminalis]|nr:hypothetical protein FQR65_LT03269 [Abscondita terminalis]